MLNTHRKMTLLSMFLCLCCTVAFAQSVKGVVKDETGEPVIGVNIVEKGTTNGTITDMDGKYTITVKDLQKAVLQFSYIGYTTIDEAVKGRSTVDVQLSSSVVNLGEVVAIGYGTQTRKEITGSVANVSEENFNKGVNRDASDLLQGKVAGLTITSGSGDVTRSSQIRLRGTSTLQNDQGPMIVIDGVPGGDMSTVSPSDIESISVLKDASSAAIYGSRAAGGVILITTKRGSGSKTQIQYDGYVTADFVANKPDLLNAAEWRAANKELGNDISVYDKYNADTDWFDEMLRTGISQNHSLSMSGGSSKSNYRASYTYLDRKGIARDNMMKRHSFRFQFQQRAINDRLRIGLTGSTTLTDMQMPFADDYILAYNMLPAYPVYNEDGSYFTDANMNYNQGNPVQNQNQNYKKSSNSYFYGQGDAQFEVIEGLNVKVNLYKSRFMNDYKQWEDPDNSLGDDNHGLAVRRNMKWDRDLMEWTANYTKAFGADEKHKVDAVAGYSWESNSFGSQYAKATNFAVSSMGADNIQAGNNLKIGDVTSDCNNYKLISFFGRAHYSFDERYMITATVRRDGSSKFGANHKWGWFPSVSAAWRISEESFFRPAKSWIDDLKVRASWGSLGNQVVDALGNFPYLPSYGVNASYPHLLGGSRPVAVNPSGLVSGTFTWETVTQMDFGLDVILLNNRLNATFDWYRRDTKDMLTAGQSLPAVLGTNVPVENAADLKTTGWELSLGWSDRLSSGFSYWVKAVLSDYQGEITKFTNDAGSLNNYYVGRKMGEIWGFRSTGLFQSDAEVASHADQSYLYGGKWTAGDVKYVDLNNDGKINIGKNTLDDPGDRTIIGNSTPRYSYGITAGFEFRNFDFEMFWQGVGKRDYMAGGNAFWGFTSEWDTPLKSEGDPLGANTNAYYPRVARNGGKNTNVQSRYLQNAAYLRLKNITLGYSIPQTVLGKVGISRLRVYVQGENLLTFTPLIDAFDPEIINNMTYPITKKVSVGLNLTF